MATTLDNNNYTGPQFASGTYAGTTAAQTIQIGFAPSWLITMNQTDADTVVFWHKSDTAHYLTMTTAVAQTTAAITQTDHGFTLAASDSVANENGKTFVFIAGR